MILRNVALGLIVSAGVLAGCGGDGGSCGKVIPCGGAVTGAWKVRGACVNSAAVGGSFMADCPTGKASASPTVTGSYSFNADMTYTSMLTTGGSVSLTFPPSCLTMNGITVTCSQVHQALQQDLADSPYQSASCSGSSSCTCKMTLLPQTTAESGTFTQTGTALTLNSDTGSIDGGEYCVQGNELHLITLDTTMNMGPMGTATIDSDIVLTKQ
jgi:hypothetical protein